MNIMYIHGFGSTFSPTNEKVIALGTLGNVTGPDIDYTRHPIEIFIELSQYTVDHNIDVIVGTSLGGFFASAVGTAMSLPFAMINPSVQPWETLKKFAGTHTNFAGKVYTLTLDTIEKYHQFPSPTYGFGLVLLDAGDEIIDPVYTQQLFYNIYPVVVFEGGNHRFVHIEESLDHISALVERYEEYLKQ